MQDCGLESLNVFCLERLVSRKLADVLLRSKLQICVPVVKVKVKHQGSRRMSLSIFQDNRHMKVVGSVLCTGRLYPPRNFC